MEEKKSWVKFNNFKTIFFQTAAAAALDIF